VEIPRRYGSEHFLREKRAKRPKKVFVAQMDEIDCGAACLSMITGALGNPVPMSKVKQSLSLTQHGSSLHGIVVAADALGLETCSIQTDYDDLIDVRMPAIVHFKSEQTREVASIDHFVVVYSVKESSALIADSSFGMLSLSREEFVRRWTGIVLVFNETPDFFKVTHKGERIITVTSILRANKKALLVTALVSFMITAFALVPTKMMGRLIDQLGVSSQQGFQLLAVTAMGILFSRLLGILLRFVRDWISIRLSSKIEFRLISEIHSHVLKLPIREISIRKTGDFLSRIHGMAELEAFVSQSFISIFLDLIMTIVFFAFLVMIHPKFGWIATGTFVFVSIYSYFVSNWAKRSAYRLLNETSACESLLVQNFRYINLIKSLGVEGFFNKRWHTKTRLLIKKQNAFKTQFNRLGHVEGIFALLSDMLILFLGISLVSGGVISLGEMIVAQGFFSQFMGPLHGLTQAYDSLQRANVSLERANDLLSIEREKSGRSNVPQECNDVALSGVSFSYDATSSGLLLNDINLDFKAGEFALITGKSGTGKTTLIHLILRMYDPVSGVIRINGLDIKDFNLAELRKKVGYVSQEPVLMPLTIEQNITFGESEIDEARLERAMALSNSNEFVSKLDRGLNTLLQEDGRGLSGGQKQRIALARALYREPSILILDEPTSALDKSSEKSFVKAIQNLKGRMIIIMCTHKPEAFSFADRFIEIRDGVATESTKG
jgi:subfamily B ATP-binding cassette protein HlyB/CyaB